MKHRLQFAGKKADPHAAPPAGGEPGGLSAHVRLPSDPLQTNVGQAALGAMSQEQIAQLEGLRGVNTPLPERYLGWLSDALHGDPGHLPPLPPAGTDHHRGAAGELPGAAPVRLAPLRDLGLTLGVLAGAFRGRWPDQLIRGWCLLISSTPAFWLAILLLLVFSVWLGWFPTGLSVPIGVAADSVTFLERLHHAVLPALTLSITGVSSIALHTREKMVDVMESGLRAVCPGPGGVPPEHRPAPRPAERGPARHHLAVCLGERDHRRLGAWWSRCSPTPAWARRR